MLKLKKEIGRQNLILPKHVILGHNNCDIASMLSCASIIHP
jgi:hypothetical protein